MYHFTLSFVIFLLSLVAYQVRAYEKHTVKFSNGCGYGTPMLIRGGQVLAAGNNAVYTSDGPLIAAIAYLQTGNCGFNGERCTIVETTLINPTTPGSGSSTDISLIPPLAFSVTTGFGYYGACHGAGADCKSASCNTAFKVPWDTHVQVACQHNNVNLVITFCH